MNAKHQKMWAAAVAKVHTTRAIETLLSELPPITQQAVLWELLICRGVTPATFAAPVPAIPEIEDHGG